MDAQLNCVAYAPAAHDSVDPFLTKALLNPRHRITVLRMELDIKKFMLNADQHQFEFQHFPTSYLRLAAHRVAQHYGLKSMVLDNAVDGLGNRIMVMKTPDSRFPTICLSDILPKPENGKTEQVKIAVRPRPNEASLKGVTEIANREATMKTVEERKDEYDRARARIFSSMDGDGGEGSAQCSTNGRSLCLDRVRDVVYKSMTDKADNTINKENTSRVAILRDREKDRSDPDYDRSYDRYVRNLTPNQNLSMGSLTMLHPPYVQCETSFPQVSSLTSVQLPINYSSSGAVMSPFHAAGSTDLVYFQWPSTSMMYTNSYEHFRHAIILAPYQQALSFDYLQH